jgi:Flp pilus assembly protein TadG
MRLPNIFQRLAKDARGAATVELALVLPFISAVLIGIVAVFPALFTQHAMRGAVAAGGEYVMAGATNVTNIQNITLNAWSGRPADGTVAVNQYCSCAGVQGACSTLCSGVAPQRFTTIQASMLYHGLNGDSQISTQEVVRTR